MKAIRTFVQAQGVMLKTITSEMLSCPIRGCILMVLRVTKLGKVKN